MQAYQTYNINKQQVSSGYFPLKAQVLFWRNWVWCDIAKQNSLHRRAALVKPAQPPVAFMVKLYTAAQSSV